MLDRLIGYVKNGPERGDGLAWSILGMWLHWRIWAVMFTITTAYLLSLYVYSLLSVGLATGVVLAIGLIMADVTDKVGPNEG